MDNLVIPQAWHETVSKLTYSPVIVKSLEKIHDTTWSMEPNIHETYEMVYIKKGTASFCISGEYVSLSPHNIVIIKPRQWHKFEVKSSSCEFIVLNFTFTQNGMTSMPSDSSHLDLEGFIENVRELEKKACITLNPGPKNEIINILRRILRERDKKEEWNDFLIYLLVLELFVYISRTIRQEWQESTRCRSMNLTESLSSAREYILANYDKEISLGDIAKYVFLSESYFAHSFKDRFGISPKSFILKTRIDASKEMLTKTDMKISDIAVSVGFLSQQRFNDIFKKLENMTPLKFRKMYKESIMNKTDAQLL